MSNRRGRSRRRTKIFNIDNRIFFSILAILIIVILLCFVIIFVLNNKRNKQIEADKSRVNQELEEIFKTTDDEVKSLENYKTDSLIRFTAVGDILCGERLENGTTDYDDVFTDVKKYLNNSDFTIGTYEEKSNDKLIKSLKNAGINYVSLAHNHALDYGSDGLVKTKETLENNNISTIGLAGQGPQDRVKIVEKKNVKIAFLAYTYDNNKQGVNIYSEEIAKEDLKYAKENAKIAVVMMHWGDVNTNETSKEQEKQAQFLIDNGANVIIGAHPSCVQKMEIKKNVEGKDCFIAYSLGDFTSDFENENANLELILDFQIFVDKNGNVTLYKVDYTPVYMIDLGKSEKNRYKILDMKKEIMNYNTDESNIDKKTYDKLVRGIERLRSIIKK